VLAEAEPRAAGAAGPGAPAQGRDVRGGGGRFGVGTATAWRYVTETTRLLAARAPKLGPALRAAKRAGIVFVVIDGTLIPVDRVAKDRPFYSGKHKKHGMNLQVISSPAGDILWISGSCPAACMT
jgi:DDE superfamily endonuclease